MNIFEELLHRLSSKTRIRHLFKDISSSDLDRILSRMNDALKEKQLAREQEDSQRQEKLESIEAIKKIMADSGVSMGDLSTGHEVPVKHRRNIKKYTFQYEINDGNHAVWQGATTGRLPRNFKSYLERTGKKRMDCVVESEE